MGIIVAFNLMYFLRVSRTTTWVNATFLVSFLFISYYSNYAVKFFGTILFSTTTPSNLTFLSVSSEFFGLFFASFLLTTIELSRKLIRPVSLTCRLRANISARHLLSAIFFRASLDALIYFLRVFYIIFEIRVALIQRFVYSFLLEDYSNR